MQIILVWFSHISTYQSDISPNTTGVNEISSVALQVLENNIW